MLTRTVTDTLSTLVTTDCKGACSNAWSAQSVFSGEKGKQRFRIFSPSACSRKFLWENHWKIVRKCIHICWLVRMLHHPSQGLRSSSPDFRSFRVCRPSVYFALLRWNKLTRTTAKPNKTKRPDTIKKKNQTKQTKTVNSNNRNNNKRNAHAT